MTNTQGDTIVGLRKVEGVTVNVGEIVAINTWGAPKANRAIVVRTYKAPDESMILALPDTAPLYAAVKTAIANKTLTTLNQWEIYPQCRTLHGSEWKVIAKV